MRTYIFMHKNTAALYARAKEKCILLHMCTPDLVQSPAMTIRVWQQGVTQSPSPNETDCPASTCT